MRGPRIHIRIVSWVLAAAAVAAPGRAQTELNLSRFGNPFRIVNADLAVLELSEDRTDLPCQVTPLKAELGFDLRFHAGYRVTIPMEQLQGNGDQLRILFHITPLDRKQNETYLVDHFKVPAIDDDAKGDASLPGGFVLGAGRYKIDWLMRDRAERVCSSHWQVEAVEGSENKEIRLSIPPDTAGQEPQQPFDEQPPVERLPGDHLAYVKILANFSPTSGRESTLKPWDVEAVVSILRSVAREPNIGRFSLVAFNMQEERVIYQEQGVERIDFPALGEAVHSLKLGVVDYRKLQDPQSGMRFLTNLLSEQLGPQTPEPDAIIIVGPKLMLDRNIPPDALRQAGRATCPIFYLNYNYNPRSNPWRDAISSALKVYRGLEYSITLPRDLAAAMTDMTLRMRKSGAGGQQPSEGMRSSPAALVSNP